jgi:hypothetical protein
MRMASPRQILGRTSKFHQNSGFLDHFAGLAADDVNAKHAIGLGVSGVISKNLPLLAELKARGTA